MSLLELFGVILNIIELKMEDGVVRYLFLLLFFFSVVFISGCTKIYNKPGGTEQELAKDHAECMALCGQASANSGCGFVEHVYDACMKGRGWIYEGTEW